MYGIACGCVCAWIGTLPHELATYVPWNASIVAAQWTLILAMILPMAVILINKARRSESDFMWDFGENLSHLIYDFEKAFLELTLGDIFSCRSLEYF